MPSIPLISTIGSVAFSSGRTGSDDIAICFGAIFFGSISSFFSKAFFGSFSLGLSTTCLGFSATSLCFSKTSLGFSTTCFGFSTTSLGLSATSLAFSTTSFGFSITSLAFFTTSFGFSDRAFLDSASCFSDAIASGTVLFNTAVSVSLLVSPSLVSRNFDTRLFKRFACLESSSEAAADSSAVAELFCTVAEICSIPALICDTPFASSSDAVEMS